MIAVRAAYAGEAAAIASAVGEQPLFARYGATAGGLRRTLEGALSRGETILVAEEAGAIAGFAWFFPTGTLSLGGYLRLIAVAPGREGRGTGGALLDEVERLTARDSRHLFLLVTQDNDGARRFYARRGYREVGPLPSLVKPGLDEILMWRVLR